MVIDHINRNGLDCRRFNMRFATYSVNGLNADKSDANGGGVYYMIKNRKWRAYGIKDTTGKQEHLGMFATREEAIQARQNYLVSMRKIYDILEDL